MQKIIYFFIFSVLTFVAAAQTIDSTLFTTDKRPLLDSTAQKKGFLGGRLSTSGVPDLKDTKDKANKFKSETLPELGLKIKKAKAEVKKVVNKNEYEGIKMEKRISTFGSGNRQTTEEFCILNDEAEISMYARDLRWFDYKMQRTSAAPIKDWDNVSILHGPYKRYVGDELVEEGFFYLGTKHGRWESYGKDADGDPVLIDKQYYYKGNPKDSKISYHDAEKSKIHEIIPIVYGKQTGHYFAYYPSGNIKTEGHFDDGIKVGKWIDYYEFGTGSKRKKEVQFCKDKFDTDFESFTMREYDEKSKLIFENTDKIKEMERDN